MRRKQGQQKTRVEHAETGPSCLEKIRQEAPLLSPLRFISDAAGAAYRWEFGVKQNLSVPGDRGAASVGYDEAGPVFLATIKWPDRLLTVAKGTNGASFGSHRLTTPVLSNPRGAQRRTHHPRG